MIYLFEDAERACVVLFSLSRSLARSPSPQGHTFTVEPMINLGPSWADTTWPDNWTAVTKDGRHRFSKVLSMVPFSSECSRTLTFQNVCDARQALCSV